MAVVTDAEVRNCSSVWFYRLEVAHLENDFEKAAEAQRQLKRLGVIVKYKRENRSIRRGASSL